VWSIPALTVILLGGVAWIGSHQLDPAAPVQGTGSRSGSRSYRSTGNGCSFIRNRGIATVNALTVPAGAPLHFELTSGSVMTAFFIPQLGSMIYTMNGMVTRLKLRADNEGTLQGLAAHFSGDGFPNMSFDVHVVPQLAFPDWVKSTARTGSVLNAESYQKLARQSVETTNPTYRLDDPRLFEGHRHPNDPARPGAATDVGVRAIAYRSPNAR